MPVIPITKAEFELLSSYLYQLTGIHLPPEKQYLAESRLSSLLTELNLRSYTDLVRQSRVDRNKTLESWIIDRMTTQETLFFRDQSPYDLLRFRIVPDIIDRKMATNKHLPVSISVWSAGCATGQEPYSIAMTLREMLPASPEYHIRILATDISGKALKKAQDGIYHQTDLQRGINNLHQLKFFQKNAMGWQLDHSIRSMVTFKKINLNLPFIGIGKFDIIFCRNVGIYFTIEDRRLLFARLAQVLNRQGSLIIGTSESLIGISEEFEPNRHLKTCYYTLKKDRSEE